MHTNSNLDVNGIFVWLKSNFLPAGDITFPLDSLPFLQTLVNPNLHPTMRALALAVTFLGLTQGFSPALDSKSTFRTNGKRDRNVIVLNDIAMSDVAVPVALFLAAAAASIVKSDKKEEAVAAVVVKSVAPVVIAPEEPVVEAVPDVKPVTKKAAPKKESPAPKPVAEKPAPVPPPVKVEPAPKVVASKPAPVPEPAPEPVRKTKDISQLKMEVASTLEQEKEKISRLRAAEERAKAATAAAEEPEEEFVEEFLEESPVTGRKRKFVMKVLKKVIAPWRNWATIN